jgi:hypothetical protein
VGIVGAVSWAKRSRGRAPAAAFAVLASLALPSAASAAVSSVFASQTVSGSAVACVAQSDGVRVCHGSSSSTPDTRLQSFDGRRSR